MRKIPTSTLRVMYVRPDLPVFFFPHLFPSCDGAASLSFTALGSEARKPKGKVSAYLRHESELCLSRCDKF